MSKYKTVEPFLGFWKKGDDFKAFLERAGGNAAEACSLYAEFCRENAAALQNLSSELRGMEGVTADGDTHMIWITLKEEDAAKLVDKELVFLSPCGEDEDEGEDS